MSGDIAALARSIFDSFKSYLDAELPRRIAALPKAVDGKDGRDGEDGQPGTPGKDGQDADVAAITASLVLEMEKAVAAIPRPKDGRDGVDGKSVSVDEVDALVIKALDAIPRPQDGRDGKDGQNGVDGISPSVEAIVAAAMPAMAEMVKALPQPKDGRDGTSVSLDDVEALVAKAVDAIPKPQDGRDGRDATGEPGRDALQIDVLPAIDIKRSYPRATFASHNGGLWRSRSTTAGMDGWECIVEGTPDLQFEMAGERTLSVRAVRSSGATIEKSFKVPVVIDRGVYKDGDSYEAGDGVTWARNYWIARRQNNVKPEAGPDWRIAVKGGRDGKDAVVAPKQVGPIRIEP